MARRATCWKAFGSTIAVALDPDVNYAACIQPARSAGLRASDSTKNAGSPVRLPASWSTLNRQDWVDMIWHVPPRPSWRREATLAVSAFAFFCGEDHRSGKRRPDQHQLRQHVNVDEAVEHRRSPGFNLAPAAEMRPLRIAPGTPGPPLNFDPCANPTRWQLRCEYEESHRPDMRRPADVPVQLR